eukprot:scaffold3596_cov316-Prasinococcus_capsulatus_cf.AAC.10
MDTALDLEQALPLNSPLWSNCYLCGRGSSDCIMTVRATRRARPAPLAVAAAAHGACCAGCAAARALAHPVRAGGRQRDGRGGGLGGAQPGVLHDDGLRHHPTQPHAAGGLPAAAQPLRPARPAGGQLPRQLLPRDLPRR